MNNMSRLFHRLGCVTKGDPFYIAHCGAAYNGNIWDALVSTPLLHHSRDQGLGLISSYPLDVLEACQYLNPRVTVPRLKSA